MAKLVCVKMHTRNINAVMHPQVGLRCSYMNKHTPYSILAWMDVYVNQGLQDLT